MDAVSAATLSLMKRYHVGRAAATSFANDYISEITSELSKVLWEVRGRFALTKNR
jgi:hypothetical protein